MRSRILLTAFFMALLSGCAATNLVEHYAWKNFKEDKTYQNEIREIKQVKLKPNGDVEICFVGNQWVENSDHTIHLYRDTYTSCGFGIPASEQEQHRNKSCPEKLERDVYWVGCTLELSEGDQVLPQESCCYPYLYRNEKQLPFETLRIQGSQYGVHLSLQYPERESVDRNDCKSVKSKWVEDEYGGGSWIRNCHPDLVYSRPPVIKDKMDFTIDPGPPARPPHTAWNKVAFWTDVITAPIQWTLCLLTWGYVCSEPHLGAIVPG